MRTLSNFHLPTILKAGSGVRRRKKNENGKRERTQSEVPCPEQQKYYSETFHLIDKENGKEAKYDMGGHSKKHNWSPKIFWRLFNIALSNAYTLYRALVKERPPDQKPLKMKTASSFSAMPK